MVRNSFVNNAVDVGQNNLVNQYQTIFSLSLVQFDDTSECTREIYPKLPSFLYDSVLIVMMKFFLFFFSKGEIEN